MVSSRLKSIIVNAILLAAASAFGATSAFAGIFTPNTRTIAHEVLNPAGTTNVAFGAQVYSMGIPRNQSENFILRYRLTNGRFASSTPVLTSSTANVAISLRSGGVGSTEVEFDVNVTALAGTAIGDTFTLNGFFNFQPGGAAVGTITTVGLDLRDVVGPIDCATALCGNGAAGGSVYIQNLAIIGATATFTALTDNLTVIDALVTVPPLSQFVVANDDTAFVARTAVPATATVVGVKAADGVTDYTLVAGDLVTFTVTGNFTGISFGYDLNNDGVITVGGGTAANENFTIVGNTATLTVNGNRLGNAGARMFATIVLVPTLDPRTFSITASIVAAVAGPAARAMTTANANWWVWSQNGTRLEAPYVTVNNPGNITKVRFVNSSAAAITIVWTLTLDQGAFNVLLGNTGLCNLPNRCFTVPANGSTQISLDAAPAPGTGELGPAVAITAGVNPMRGKMTFTAFTAAANVLGQTLISSPVGVITVVQMDIPGFAH